MNNSKWYLVKAQKLLHRPFKEKLDRADPMKETSGARDAT